MPNSTIVLFYHHFLILSCWKRDTHTKTHCLNLAPFNNDMMFTDDDEIVSHTQTQQTNNNSYHLSLINFDILMSFYIRFSPFSSARSSSSVNRLFVVVIILDECRFWIAEKNYNLPTVCFIIIIITY